MSVLAFVAVRWLQNQIYSNETVALLAPEGQKEAKARKRKHRAGRSVKSVCRASGEGRWEKSGGTVGKRQRGSKLSNKQEKAKGKAQEV